MKELFDRYLEGNCNEEERLQVENWLKQAGERELDLLLWVKWEQAQGAMPENDTAELLQQLQDQLGYKNKPGRLRRLQTGLRISAAACVVAVAGTLGFMFYDNHKTIPVHQQAEVIKVKQTETWTYTSNTTSLKKEIKLEDGSLVTLQPQAFIRYRAGFEPNQRAVYLAGEATFNVTHDKRRPFSVHSGNITTLALGTRFYVNAGDMKAFISVRLFEGSVLISHDSMQKSNKVILKPGEEYRYNSITEALAVLHFSEKSSGEKVSGTDTPAEPGIMKFNNTALEDVLVKLREQYQTSVEFNKKEIKDIRFTGKITISDSLQTVLQAIAQMNELTLEQSEQGFRIHKR